MNKVNGMKAVCTIACIAILLLFTVPVFAQETATIHGVVYEWDTFAPLNNTVVEINSTPVQSIVARYGIYSFDLPNGTYLITAQYFEDEQLTYYGEDIITVSDNGSYTVDILLLPAYPDDSSRDITLSSQDISSSKAILFSLSLLIIILIVLFHRLRVREPDVHPEKPSMGPGLKYSEDSTPVQKDDICEENYDEMENIQARAPLSSEQLEIIEILRRHGGHISQKELRSYLEYSEGKASLLIVDIEKKGYISKVRKGRGNELFLIEQDD